MVAVVIFGIGVIGAFAAFTAGTIFLNVENHKRTAAEIAYGRQEELRTVSFAGLPSCREEGYAVEIDGLPGTRATGVEEVDENEDGAVDHCRVTVDVTWRENGRDQKVELVTLRCRYR